MSRSTSVVGKVPGQCLIGQDRLIEYYLIDDGSEQKTEESGVRLEFPYPLDFNEYLEDGWGFFSLNASDVTVYIFIIIFLTNISLFYTAVFLFFICLWTTLTIKSIHGKKVVLAW